MARDVLVRPSGTSWGAVLDGWLATVGVAAILTPLVALLLANMSPGRGYSATVPVLASVGLAYLIGGYVAGRMAGYRTSWHGMMVAFFGVFVVLALLVIDVALALGLFGSSGRLVAVLPDVLGVNLFTSAESFAFGGALGLLIAIFAGWLGGLLAPAREMPVVSTQATVVEERPVVEETPVVARERDERAVTTTEVRRPRSRFRLLPAAGRKGGERVEEAEVVERTERIDRS